MTRPRRGAPCRFRGRATETTSVELPCDGMEHSRSAAARRLSPLLIPLAAALLATPLLLGSCGDSGKGSDSAGPDLANGRQLYRDYCGSCHGRDFEGTELGPSQLDEAYRPENTSDEAFRTAIQKGAAKRRYNFATGMPPIPSLSDTDITDITAYVRSVQKERGFNTTTSDATGGTNG